jgi:hypothetical protein
MSDEPVARDCYKSTGLCEQNLEFPKPRGLWAPRATVERAFLSAKKAPPKQTGLSGHAKAGGYVPPSPILKPTPMRRRPGTRHIPAAPKN